MKNIVLKKSTMWKYYLLFAFVLSAIGFISCSDDDAEDITTFNVEISLDKSGESLTVGDILTITPNIKGTNADKLDYTWSSSNKEVAKVVQNADNSATITALSAGSTIIKIESSKYGEFSATCNISVTGGTVEPSGPIRILAIGNSFSQDAVEQYFYELAEAADIDIVVANLYIGGCSLEKHLSNSKSNAADYEFRKTKNGTKTNKSGMTLLQGLEDEEWDYISLQQVSGNSGQYDTYAASLPELVAYVKEKALNKNVKLMMHQTWAYPANSDHADFPKYDKDQMKMYNAIVDAVNRAAQLVDIDIIIPAGTAIQNGRTSYLGDSFNRDGNHLETTYGRYTAACTWFEKIFNRSVVGNSYAPSGLHKSKVDIAQNAAHAAVLQPNAITTLVEFAKPPVDTQVMKTPIYIDFGSSASATPWNNFSSYTSSTDGTALIDTDGDYTKYTIRVSKSFSSIFAGVGTEPTTAINVGFDVPASAYKDGLLVEKSSGVSGELQMSNLDPSLKYTLTIVGLRWNSGVARNTDYKITGSTTQTKTLAVGTKVADEVKDKYIIFENVTPDASGNITIEVSCSADNIYQAVISAMQIRLAE